MAKSTNQETVAPKNKKKATAKTNPQQEKQSSLISNNDRLRINIPWSELKKPYQKTINDYAKSMKIEGFRQGKVPASIVEKQISLEKVAEVILKEILPQKYVDALKQTKKQAITAPEYHLVSLKKGEEWIIEAHFCEAPQINLKNYEAYINNAKKAAAQFIKKQNEQNQEKNSVEKDKKAVKNKTTDQSAKESDQAAKKLSPDQEQEVYYQHILRELVINIRPSIGELLLRRETQAEFERFKEQLTAYKISVEKYLEQRQISLDELGNELASTVLNRLQIDFILAAIARDRHLAVDEKSLNKALNEIKDEKLREQITGHQQFLDSFKAQLLRRQTIESLLKN